MSDPYSPLLEALFPSSEPSDDLRRRLQLSATKVAARKRRRTIGLIAALGVLGFGGLLVQPFRAARYYGAMADVAPNEVVQVAHYDRGVLRSIQWKKGETTRSRYSDSSTRSFALDGYTQTNFGYPESIWDARDRYTYYPERNQIVHIALDPSSPEQRITRINPFVATLAAAFQNVSVRSATYAGHAAEEVTFHDDRTQFRQFFDVESRKQLATQTLLQDPSGRWSVFSESVVTMPTNVPPRFFEPRSLAPAPIVELRDIQREFVRSMLATELGRLSMGHGALLSLRAAEATKEGDVFIVYTGPAFGSGGYLSAVAATDDAGDIWIPLRSYAAGGEAICSDPDAPDASVRFCVFSPLVPGAVHWPLRLTFTAYTDGQGSFARPNFGIAKVYNMYGHQYFTKTNQPQTWGSVSLTAPTSHDYPSFRVAWQGFMGNQLSSVSVDSEREQYAFQSENWAAVEKIELSILNAPSAPSSGVWQRYNSLVAAALGQDDKVKAERYRKLRDQQTDRPTEHANYWERTFSHVTTVPRAN